MEPQRWSTIEKPAVYICATIAAILLYVGLTMKDSQLESGMIASNEALIELGERGLYATVVDAVPVEPFAFKILSIIIGTGLLAIGVWQVSILADQKIEDMESDAQTPTAQQTHSYAKRSTVEEYEMTKMEYTRK